MAFTIEYTGFCIQGLVRKNNEDNICWENKFLPVIRKDDDSSLSGFFGSNNAKSFAVFDGIGGEECGEIASHLAARTFGHSGVPASLSFSERTRQLSRDMNYSIQDYARKNRIRVMGTTVVSLFFEQSGITGFNIGNSRCYRFSGDSFVQLSSDHVITDGTNRAECLTRYLGVSEQKQTPEPALYFSEYREGDLYLLCTDGLTKMVSDRRIALILKKRKSLQDKLQELKELVLKKGAVDNTTVLLFQISGRKPGFSNMIRACRAWLAGY